jgi:hypothetical protein
MVPFLETAMACGWLYPNPRVSCASITTDGACAQPLEAQKASVRTRKQNNFHFDTEYLTGNLDGITGMATALLYNFRSPIVYGDSMNLQPLCGANERRGILRGEL